MTCTGAVVDPGKLLSWDRLWPFQGSCLSHRRRDRNPDVYAYDGVNVLSHKSPEPQHRRSIVCISDKVSTQIFGLQDCSACTGANPSNLFRVPCSV